MITDCKYKIGDFIVNKNTQLIYKIYDLFKLGSNHKDKWYISIECVLGKGLNGHYAEETVDKLFQKLGNNEVTRLLYEKKK